MFAAMSWMSNAANCIEAVNLSGWNRRFLTFWFIWCATVTDVDIHGWNGVDSAVKVQSHSRELHGYGFGRLVADFPGIPPDYSKSKREARPRG